MTFEIQFVDENDAIITARIVDAPSDWDACQLGHQMLEDNSIFGATDFDVEFGEE